MLLSTSVNKQNKVGGDSAWSSQVELMSNPVENHRLLAHLNKGNTSLIDGHMKDLPEFMLSKAQGRVNS